MVAIRQLGYLIFGSADIAGWRSLAEDVIGFTSSDVEDGGVYLKMDERDYRIAVLPDSAERLIACGWEISDQAAFEAIKVELAGSGIEVNQGSPAERALRKVHDFVWLTDPSGNRVELYWGFISGFIPYRPPARGPSGFVADDTGLGHVVLPAQDLEALQAFYAGKLGFGLSDIINMRFGPGDVRVNFNHCGNERQHSLALAGMPSPNGCVHFCVEVPALKDVGMALDRVQDAGHPLVLTLGQHVNDDCVSFYFLSPQGFMIEIGWNSVRKDWTRHTVFETTRASHWGHRFVLTP